MALKISLEDPAEWRHAIEAIERDGECNDVFDKNMKKVRLWKNEFGWWRAGYRGPWDAPDESYFRGLSICFGH